MRTQFELREAPQTARRAAPEGRRLKAEVNPTPSANPLKADSKKKPWDENVVRAARSATDRSKSGPGGAQAESRSQSHPFRQIR